LDNHIQVALRTVQCLIGRRAPYSAMPHWTEGTVQCNASLDGGHRTVQCLTGRRAPYSAMPHWTEGTVQCNASLDGGHRTGWTLSNFRQFTHCTHWVCVSCGFMRVMFDNDNSAPYLRTRIL